MNEIVTGIDTTFTNADLGQLTEIDTVFAKAHQAGDVGIVIHAVQGLLNVNKLSALGIAKLLYMTHRSWNDFHVQDSFENVIQDMVGLSPVTVSRYIRVWGMYAEQSLPMELIDIIQQKPMKDQVAISNLVYGGYDVEPEQWEKIAESYDNSSLLSTIRQVKGVEPRKNSLQIFMKRNGDLTAYIDGEPVFLGFLVQSPETAKAVNRIVDSAGILME